MRHIPGVSLHWPAESKASLLASPGAKIVEKWRYIHTKINKWRDIGYHYIVHRDANGIPQVYEGRPDSTPGAHSGTNAGNQFLGVNVAYGMDESVPDAMFMLLAQLIADLSKAYGFPITRNTVKGHREFIATQCPGDKLFSRMDELIDLANKLKSDKPEVKQFKPELPAEENIFPARVKFRTGDTIPAILVNSQTYVHVSELGEIERWDGESRTVYMK